MNEFVKAGAPADILFEAHPHIGTFKLVKVVENMRAQIVALGGEIRFEQRVTDVLIEDGPEGKQLRGLTVLDQATGQSQEMRADQVVMALGHSSRDTFAMLYERGVYIEAKPFSIGFRVEHPQGIIDRARWGRHAGHPLAGRGRIQAGAPREQRPLGLQLLHVPGRHGGRRHLGARPRGDQRHEPVLAQRAQRQRRHRGGHRPARLPRL